MINLNNERINKYLLNFFSVSTFFFFLGIYTLSRTFMGIYILGFRIGELAILFSLLFLIFSILFFKKNEYTKIFSNTKIREILTLIILSFILNLILSDSSPSNTYTFKSSSYIWSIGFMFFGLLFSYYFELKKSVIRLFIFLFLYLYYFSFYGVNNDIQNYFLNISDKFDYHKGSDVFLFLITTIFLYVRLEKNKTIGLEILIITYSFFSPLILYKSRGAFLGLSLFFILELFNLRKNFRKNILRNILLLLISIFLFFQSLSLVTKNGIVEVDEVRGNVEFISSYRALPSSEILEQKLFYVYEKRLYSSDGNLNWRLQIWQDIISDLYLKNKLLIGYGYKSIIPAMDDPFRAGDDGTNENVHNFLINILARGGLVHLLLFLLFFIEIFRFGKKIKKLKIYNFILPIFLVSFFDSSMENSHFPLIFYFIIGLIIQLNKSNNISVD